MYKRALIPLDGSPVAEAILPFVVDIAGPLDMEVVLLRVFRTPFPAVLEDSAHVEYTDPDTLRTEAEEYLAPLAAELRAKGLRVRTLVRQGDAPIEIVAGARAAGADLIAMTTHGRSGPARLLFGSVAEAVLRRAEIPVFLMKQTEAQVARRQAVAAGHGG